MTNLNRKKSKYLVVDATPLLEGIPLYNLSENVFTVEDVANEIKNKRQLRHIKSQLCDIEVVNVQSESILFATEFAKKTGDYSALSAADIKLIALTRQLHLQHQPNVALREAPVLQHFILNQPKNTMNQEAYNNEKNDTSNDVVSQFAELDVNDNGYKDDCSNVTADPCDSSEIIQGALAENDEDNTDSEEDEWFEALDESEYEYSEEDEDDEDINSDEDDGVSPYNYSVNDANKFGGGEWITTSNLNKVRNKVVYGLESGDEEEDKQTVVACMTTDYAVQNVLKQMGLEVMGLDGRTIKNLRIWTLRCYACFKVCWQPHRQFCPSCGLRTLKRVSVYVDADGNKQIFINFKKPISTRGKRFSLPKMESGKHAVNPRLVEDARKPQQKVSKLARLRTNPLDPDYQFYVNGGGGAPFVRRDVYSRSAQLGFGCQQSASFRPWMRKNPNQNKKMPKTRRR